MISFPSQIDLVPGHKIDTYPGSVFAWDTSGRIGLGFRSDIGDEYFMWTTREYDMSGSETLNPIWTEEKVGRVSWGVAALDGYEREQYTISGHIIRATDLLAYEDIAAFNVAVCSRPVIAVYRSVQVSRPTYYKISGLYRYVPNSKTLRWPMGHTSGLVEITFKIEQVAAGCKIINPDGTAQTVNADGTVTAI